ncbi:hypothetical protein H312_03099 [Anncaliia algerae PRA339]|uniref:Uncharacterized protein n=1 Tax=Anncaliia algerae PRA339 TaxID=1288291 RepID=A0A059EXC4_9MICR|nr:hypothetical protein H312_03099 [Anncaliia algerae PRA339]
MVKKRRESTKDLMTIISSMLETNTSNKQIAKTLDLSLKTAWRIIKKIGSGEKFISAGEKRKLTCNERRSTFNPVYQLIHNSILCNNSLKQIEIKNIVSNQHKTVEFRYMAI